MPTGDVLTPREALYIATNAYFTLKDWIEKKPIAGVESRESVNKLVLGAGNAGKARPGEANPTLKGTNLATGKIDHIHTATTGISTTSGFGYTLSYTASGRSHVIIATRGTRPEMPGKPDLITDLRASMTSFSDYGLVHKGFKKTFDSILPNLARSNVLIEKAHVVHCVGHSLGGAVATLIAGHYRAQGKNVKLYTFGSPRVGVLDARSVFETRIGRHNIYRVAHDLDPISLIGPYPYIHVNASRYDRNNMTLPSPSGALLSTENHDMAQYIRSIGAEGLSWETVRGFSSRVDYDNSLIARWLLHEDNNPGWVQYASAKTLGLLFKLFNQVLKDISTSLILGLTAVDLLAEVLLRGLHKLHGLGAQIMQLLRYAAQWAGITIAQGVDFTAEIIRLILSKMLAAMQVVASRSLDIISKNLVPIYFTMGAAWTLNSYGVI